MRQAHSRPHPRPSLTMSWPATPSPLLRTHRLAFESTALTLLETCQNTEGEPAIRADRAGNFYGSSENVFCVIGGQCGGTFAWKSIDGGNSFTTLKLPNSPSNGTGPVGF